MTDATDDLRHRRESSYGPWRENSKTMQAIKNLFRSHPGWAKLDDSHREALDMFALKIGRILCGNPNWVDNWDDLGGYARCVAALIIEEKRLSLDAKTKEVRRTPRKE